ncbi:hypothetical protein STIAU_2889, partial [Stigmatella aurantiaca DW4/3-1]
AGGHVRLLQEANLQPLLRRLGQLLRRALHEGERLLQFAREQLGPERPVQSLRVARPVQEVARVAGHPRHRQRLAVLAGHHRLAPPAQRGDVRIEDFLERHPALVRGDAVGADLRAGQVRARRGPIQADAAQLPLVLLLSALHREEVDPVRARPEVRLLTVLREPARRAAVLAHHVEPRVPAVEPRQQVSAPGGAVDDGAAIRRERRLQVEPRLRAHHLALAPTGGHHAHGAELVVVPRGVNDGLAVPRERRVHLEVLRLLRQPARKAIGQLARIKVSERLVHHPVPLGRHLHPPQHLHREALGDHGLRLRGVHACEQGPGALHVKGNGRHALAGHVDAVQLSLRPEDERLAVRRPGHRRVHAMDGPRLLHVAVEPIEQRALGPRDQVRGEQHALAAHPPHEGQRLAVRRGRGPHRAARTGDEGLQLLRLQVQPLDDVNLPVRILVVLEHLARGGVLAEVEEAAIRGERGLARILLIIGPLGELDALAARAVVEPHLARAQRAPGGEVLARHEVLAVRRPGGAVEQAEGLLRHGARVRAIPLHDPQVVAATPVAREGDGGAIRAVAGLHVPGGPRGEGLRLAAGDGQRVEVPQQVEDELVPLGAHVHAHPGALGDIEGHLGGGEAGRVDVPGGRRGRGRRGRGSRGRRLGPSGGHASAGEKHAAQQHSESFHVASWESSGGGILKDVARTFETNDTPRGGGGSVLAQQVQRTGPVVADQQGAVRKDGHVHRPAPDLVVGPHPAFDEGPLPGGLARGRIPAKVRDLVTHALGVIPRAVIRHHQARRVGLREGRPLEEEQPQRRRVRLDALIDAVHLSAVHAASAVEVVVAIEGHLLHAARRVRVGIAERPAITAPLAHPREGLGRVVVHVLGQDLAVLAGAIIVGIGNVVAPVHRHPELVRARLEGQTLGVAQPSGEELSPRPIRRVAVDRGALGRALRVGEARVAGGGDGDVEPSLSLFSHVPTPDRLCGTEAFRSQVTRGF